MTCRTPSGSTTCSGTPSGWTGAQLTYDNEGRLAAWQNQPSNPTATAKYLYDGAGQRVEGQTSSGGTTTTSVYVGTVEELVTSGSTTTTYTYYYTPDGTRLAEAINGGSPFVLGTDLLGTSQTVLLANGTSTASALYSPYGIPRYGSGAMPTDYGFTGQHSDLGTTGLDYYNARYFDPTAAQFGAADTALDGASPPNRFSYVRGNPQTATDPSGHYCMLAVMCGLGGGGAGGGGEILSPWAEPPDPSRTGGGQRSPAIPCPACEDHPDPIHQGIHPAFPTTTTPASAPHSAPQTQPGGGGSGQGGGGNTPSAGAGACEPGGGGGGGGGSSGGRITEIGQGYIDIMRTMGVEVQHGTEDAEVLLRMRGGRGVTHFWGASPQDTVVYLASNAHNGTAFEEYLHVLEGQARGWQGIDEINGAIEEVNVEGRVLDRATELGMTADEVMDLQMVRQGYIDRLQNNHGICLE